MKRLAFAACAFLAGCVLLPPPAPTADTAPLRPGDILSARAARDAVSVGRSTQADVRAALGEAVVVDFDSGYEVWVYRERLRDKATRPRTEFVLLFEPSGILARTRIAEALAL